MNIKRLLGTLKVSVLVLPFLACVPVTAHSYEIWIANEAEHADGGGTQVLDSELNLLTTIESAQEHTHMGDFNSDFSVYYSANLGHSPFEFGESSVDVINADTREIITTVFTAGRTHAVVVSEDDRFAYANNLNNNTQAIDTASNSIVNTITIGDGGTNHRPVCIGMSANSKTIYHAAAVTDRVIVVNVDNTTATEVAPQDQIRDVVNACGLLRSGNNKFMYAIAGKRADNLLADMFHVIDIATDTVVFSDRTAGIDAHAISETSNGKEIWIGNRDSSNFEIRNGRSPTYDVIEIVDLEDPKHGLPTNHGLPYRIDLFGFSPNGKELIAAVRAPYSLIIKIDVATRTVVDWVEVPGDPHGVRIRHTE